MAVIKLIYIFPCLWFIAKIYIENLQFMTFSRNKIVSTESKNQFGLKWKIRAFYYILFLGFLNPEYLGYAILHFIQKKCVLAQLDHMNRVFDFFT